MTTFNHFYQPGDAGLPTILMLHGTGGDEEDLLPIADFIAPKNSKLGIRGQLVEQGMTRYFKHLPNGGFDLESLATETDLLVTEIKRLAQEYQLDYDKMIVLGFSNGANVALYAMLHDLVPFKSGIFMHPMLLTDAEVAGASLGSVWISHGILDPIVPERIFNLLQQRLKEAHADVTVFEHEKSHEVTMPEIQAAKKWFEELK
ncbi:alpha/beta hydrolase [Paucilactobacillus wasatchensis]|uniref:Phospholipase/carboxylesterase n=1 Tax=Paucilactobacillus wasatchensis TaxID=1335616 RepID=A0A0D0Y3Z3_9LACO|nr:alpha/beta hydrolase [Paucilactobacillus wasatchensis]KIS02978.1 Phospholipase/carboxylesterase [Paucilactobacillus wasatchensis]